jgi:hypothetical protein
MVQPASSSTYLITWRGIVALAIACGTVDDVDRRWRVWRSGSRTRQTGPAETKSRTTARERCTPGNATKGIARPANARG